jgi:alanine racemase
MSNHDVARAWVEVDLPALRRNYQTIERAIGPGAAVIVMAKADGYGLGAARVVRAFEPLEPWGYGVATTEEGITLRRAGVQRPILVCEPLPPGSVTAAADAGLTACISHLSQLERWAGAAARRPEGLDFHIEIDTGMGRCGLDWRGAAEWGTIIQRYAGEALRWRGVFTHFHSADGVDESASLTQWSRFQEALGELPVARDALLVHAANSAATLRFPECRADAVRPGIYLYGGDPVPEIAQLDLPRPEPAVALRARIILVREVPPGTTVGYGGTYTARGWERWATLGIGYGDGLPRSLSNRGVALVRGKRVPMIGRISMDLVVVNLTGATTAEVGDPATLIGRDGDEEITLEEVAELAGTINHEILTGLMPRLPRVDLEAIAPGGADPGTSNT